MLFLLLLLLSLLWLLLLLVVVVVDVDVDVVVIVAVAAIHLQSSHNPLVPWFHDVPCVSTLAVPPRGLEWSKPSMSETA